MGTNYYARYNECPCCDRYDELHIGKSSAGWCFALHIYPDLGIDDLADWIRFIAKKKVKIFDEYGRQFSLKQLVNVVTLRPANSRRCPVGDAVGHGEGTWDLVDGEFS